MNFINVICRLLFIFVKFTPGGEKTEVVTKTFSERLIVCKFFTFLLELICSLLGTTLFIYMTEASPL